MILVVSDTSPLNYLILIKAEEVLPSLFGSIIVPSQVLEELQRSKAPGPVRVWANDLPSWVHIRTGDTPRFPLLNYGESTALAMAQDERGQLLVDEVDARSVATSLGVPIIGTVGILAEAHLKALLDFDTAIQALSATTFRVHANVITTARARILTRQPGYSARLDELDPEAN